MPQVLTLTLNPTIDVSGEAEAVRPIRKIRTTRTRFDPGGGGINVARVVSVLGGDAEAVRAAPLRPVLGRDGRSCREQRDHCQRDQSGCHECVVGEHSRGAWALLDSGLRCESDRGQLLATLRLKLPDAGRCSIGRLLLLHPRTSF